MKTNFNDPQTVVKVETPHGILIHKGITHREQMVIEFTKAYISAGSTGMPQPEQLAKLAVLTADALINELNK